MFVKPALKPDTERRSDTSTLVTNFVKAKMRTRSGKVWSIDTALFEAARVGSPAKSSGVVRQSQELALGDLMDGLRGLQVTLATPEQRSQTFFRVVNAFPEYKKVVSAAHATKSRSLISVVECAGSYSADEVQIFTMTGKFLYLDLAAWVPMYNLHRLFVWELASYEPVITPSPSFLSSLQDAELFETTFVPADIATASSSQTATLDDDELLADIMRPVSAAHHPQLVSQAIQAMQYFDQRGVYEDAEQWVADMDLAFESEVLDMGVIEVMLGAGILCARTGAFGREFAMVRRAVDFEVSCRLSSATSLTATDLDVESPHKIDLVLSLMRRGWIVGEQPPPYKLGSTMVMDRRMISKSVEYFKCLLGADDVLSPAGGSSMICHMMPEKYYALLMSKLPVVATLHERIDLFRLTNADFKKLLGGQVVPLLSDAAICDDDGGVLSSRGVAEVVMCGASSGGGGG